MTRRGRPPALHAAALAAALLGAVLLATSGVARAEEQAPLEAYARIVVGRVALRSGPGVSFRRVALARRSETYPVLRRSSLGHWLQVRLPDGTSAWLPVAAVYVETPADAEHEERFLGWLFAPPPLLAARGELAAQFGVLAGGGMAALRPTVYLRPEFGFELTGLAVVSASGRLYGAMGGGLLNLFPSSPIVPFVTLGGGMVQAEPNADSFVVRSGTRSAVYAGAGLRFGFRYRLVLRLEARTHVFYDPDHYTSVEEYSAGISAFF